MRKIIEENISEEEKILLDKIASDQRKQMVGFTQRFFSDVSLPYKKPKKKVVQRTIRVKDQNIEVEISGHNQTGLPYGKIPRVLLLWIITTAKIKKTRKIEINNVSQFLRDLGFPVTSKYIKRVKESLEQLYFLRFSVAENDENKSQQFKFDVMSGAFQIKWIGNDIKTLGNKDLFLDNENYFTISEAFFDLITESAFPVNLDSAIKLSRSPMAYEVYFWLTYKAATSKGKFVIGWSELKERFSPDSPKTNRGLLDFKRNFAISLALVKEEYPNMNSKIIEKGLLFVPSRPHIEVKQERLLEEYNGNLD